MKLVIEKTSLKCYLYILILAVLAGCGSNSTSNMSQQEFLPVEQAFAFSAEAESSQLLKTRWKIADGYHLYKDKFKFSVSPESVTIASINYPKAEMFSDKNLGKLESYKGSIEVLIKLSSTDSKGKIQLTSQYQGCADVGLCYPPETKQTEFDLASL